MSLKNWIMGRLQACALAIGLSDLHEQIASTKLLIAGVLIRQIKEQGLLTRLAEAEFKVFSQFGDDGIIQYLIQQVIIPENSKKFIEFGVQDYQESNTRFLLMNDNWTGLIFDGSSENIQRAAGHMPFWRYALTAVPAFIDRDNVNDLFLKNGFEGQIGLLSIDIDGNDYWVWESVCVVNPLIVVCEYNSVFGADHAVTIPYAASFQRGTAHYSNLYWGASLKALCNLASRKGYIFVGSNSAGNNAYFVREDALGSLRPLTCAEGFVRAKFRESRNRDGILNYLPVSEQLSEIGHLPVVDVERQVEVLIYDIFNLKRPEQRQ